MNASQNAFEQFRPFLFGILMLSVVVGLALTARLHRLLRTRQPDVYDSLGRPTLFLNNTIRNGWAFQRFLLGGHFQEIDDPETLRLCRFMRIFAYCYLAFIIGFVLFGFLCAPAPSSR